MVKKTLCSFIIIILFLLIWQGFVEVSKIPTYILPTPSDIFLTWVQQHTLLAHEAVVTIIETLLGFIIGALFGFYAAIMILYIKPAQNWILPILLVSQAIPTFALAPILVVWFGYGLASKIIITVIMIFFPITSSFYDGLKRTPSAYLDLAKTMRISKFKTLWHIQIPAALPSLASGLRVSATIAPMGAVIGEWVGSSQGLGYLMMNANAHLNISLMFAALITLMMFTLILYFAVDALTRKLITW